jgi:lipopolysaccharide export LptBFGC system permease protein LptF
MGKHFLKQLSIAFLVLISVVTTVISFGLFEESYPQVFSTQINLEQENEIIVKEVLEQDSSKRLIPLGAIKGVNEVDEVNVNYDVSILGKHNNALKLVIEVENVLIDGDSVFSDLVNIEIVQSSESFDSPIKVTAVVTLSLPENETEFLAISNKPITFMLKFTAIQS